MRKLTLISLFSGAGGLDRGLEAAGFQTKLCVELDEDARQTLRVNRPHWTLADPGDIRRLSPDDILEQSGCHRRQVALLAGGPPCQPFSKSRYWAGAGTSPLDDPRAGMLDQYLRVLGSVLPQVFLLENVAGLAFRGKNEGIQLLLDGVRSINQRAGTRYAPQILEVNAADYGVPQVRHRVFILGHRQGLQLALPPPTHGENDERLEPFRTAWDAIGELDDATSDEDLRVTGEWADLLPSIPEGKNYLWHTQRGGGVSLFGWRTRYWSFLLKLAKDRPAWTIQAAPGPATGPFHWRSRRLSIAELARLQTFPRDYRFVGNYTSCHRQIGNAVPPAIGELLGLEIRRQMFGQQVRKSLMLTPTRCRSTPRASRVHDVPAYYHKYLGDHLEHPGVGRGPGAWRLALNHNGRQRT